jgi:2-polyprenyl-3-methyl-5-hydroxy-6-metoxy-1,4-benzoquinol methylase
MSLDVTTCRFCGSPLDVVCADLGMQPLANSYVREDQLASMEPFFPLRVLVCGSCMLVQSEQYESPETIFSDYAYFSSFSKTWLEHCKRYVDDVVRRYDLGPQKRVVELASNDGYLLQYFVERGIPVLGIEPARNVAKVAIAKGIPTIAEFFDTALGRELAATAPADLLVGNNVLAHVPDINGFVGGMKEILAPRGTITMEFPHLLNLLELNQFDTIYHEHFSYLSVLSAQRVFNAHGLRIFDVEQISTHGGSLRIHGCHIEDPRPDQPGLRSIVALEDDAGMGDIATYVDFGLKAIAEKRRILELLIGLKDAGQTIVGYGAAAKGNTLLNYCGIRGDFLDYTCDLNTEKQGLYLPGVRIPIRSPDEIPRTRPDYVFILPWNLRDEIMDQLSDIRDWGGRFISRAPSVEIFE